MNPDFSATPVKQVTFDDISAMMRETYEYLRGLQKETDKLQKETDKQIKEHGIQLKEHAIQMKESERQYKEQLKEQERRHKEQIKEQERRVSDINKRMGGITNTFGTWVESYFKRSTLAMFKKMGYTFDRGGKREFYDKAGRSIVEVDDFLENGDVVLAIEIKSSLTNRYIDEHLERLAKLREIFDKKGDTRKILGAVASMSFGGNCDVHAITNGLFVIKQTGENVTLQKTPADWKPKEF